MFGGSSADANENRTPATNTNQPSNHPEGKEGKTGQTTATPLISPVNQPVVVVTGANRGLGLEFVRQLLEGGHQAQSGVSNDCIVIACCRSPDQATELKKLKSMYAKRLDIFQLDVSKKDQIDTLAKHINDVYGRLDILISNAGVLKHTKENPDTADKIPLDTIKEVMEVNVYGPILLIRALAPILRRTHDMLAKTKPAPAGDDKPTYVRAIFITSVAASMGAAINGFASYCMSKAALDRWVLAASQVYPEIAFGLMHPGWVDTDMGRIDGGEPETSPKVSIRGMLQQLPKVTRANSARQILAFDGTVVPF